MCSSDWWLFLLSFQGRDSAPSLPHDRHPFGLIWSNFVVVLIEFNTLSIGDQLGCEKVCDCFSSQQQFLSLRLSTRVDLLEVKVSTMTFKVGLITKLWLCTELKIPRRLSNQFPKIEKLGEPQLLVLEIWRTTLQVLAQSMKKKGEVKHYIIKYID